MVEGIRVQLFPDLKAAITVKLRSYKTDMTSISCTKKVGADKWEIHINDNVHQEGVALDVLLHECTLIAAGGEYGQKFDDYCRRLQFKGRGSAARPQKRTTARRKALQAMRQAGPMPGRSNLRIAERQVLLHSVTIPGYYLSTAYTVIRRHGLPKDPNGVPLVTEHPEDIFSDPETDN